MFSSDLVKGALLAVGSALVGQFFLYPQRMDKARAREEEVPARARAFAQARVIKDSLKFAEEAFHGFTKEIWSKATEGLDS